MALKDINEATREELTAVPQMGEARAETIIHHRERLGGFTSVQQLAEVPGISETMAEQIGAYFSFPEGQEEQSAEGEDDESNSAQALEDADDERPVTSEDQADDDESDEPVAEDDKAGQKSDDKQPRRATSRKAPAKRSAG